MVQSFSANRRVSGSYDVSVKISIGKSKSLDGHNIAVGDTKPHVELPASPTMSYGEELNQPPSRFDSLSSSTEDYGSMSGGSLDDDRGMGDAVSSRRSSVSSAANLEDELSDAGYHSGDDDYHSLGDDRAAIEHDFPHSTSEKQHSVRRALRGLGQAISHNVGKAATRAKDYAYGKLLTAQKRYHAGSKHTQEKLGQKKDAREERITRLLDKNEGLENARRFLIKDRKNADKSKSEAKADRDLLPKGSDASKYAKQVLREQRKESKQISREIKKMDTEKSWRERKIDRKIKQMFKPERFENTRKMFGGIKNIFTGKR